MMSNPGKKLPRLVALLALSYGVLGVLSLAQAQGNSGGSNVKHLGDLNCSWGQVPKFDGSNWICAPDVTGITGVIAGPGLLGGGFSENVTLSLDTSYLQKNYANVKIVAKSGGDFTTVGAALASITDNGPNNGYLVFVAPGTYNEAVTLKPYVHVKGAGQGITVIASTVTTAFGTVFSVTNATVSDLTVINADSSGTHTAVRQFGGLLQDVTVIADGASGLGIEMLAGLPSQPPPTLQNVTVRVSGASTATGIAVFGLGPSSIQNSSVTVSGSGVNRGIVSGGRANIDNSVVVASGTGDNTGVRADHGSATIRNSVITASGGSNIGIYAHDGGMALANSSVSATGGTSNTGFRGTPQTGASITNSTITASGGSSSVGVEASEINMTIDASRLIGDTAALNQTAGPPGIGSVKVGASMLKGAVNASGQFACVGAYNGDYIALNSICQ